MRKRIEESITCMKYIDVPKLSAYLIFPAVYRQTLANYLTDERMAYLEVVPLLFLDKYSSSYLGLPNLNLNWKRFLFLGLIKIKYLLIRVHFVWITRPV
jgi:hypothetical protein